VLVDEKADIDKFGDFTVGGAGEARSAETGASQPKKAEKPQQAAPAQEQAAPINEAAIADVFISPRARRLMAINGAANLNVKGSGPEGRVIEQDVQNALKGTGQSRAQPQQQAQAQSRPQPQAQAQPQTPTQAPTPALSKPKSQAVRQNIPSSGPQYDVIEASSVRQVIAKRLTESKQLIPHYYLESEIDMTKLLAFKKKVLEESGKKFSINDFIIKACAMSCQDIPETNSQWINNKIHKFYFSDICFAVDVPAGLITPIVKNADTKSLSQINADVAKLIEKARKNELKPEEYIVS